MKGVILTSNRCPSDWYPLFPNPVVGESILDGVLNTSHHLLLEGNSYRPPAAPRARQDDRGPGAMKTRSGGCAAAHPRKAVMTGMIEVAPGDLGTPPNRQSGPVAAYMLEGEIIFELEGEPERVIKAGDAFWEPGGDVIHYQSANNLQDSWSRYLIVMMCVPGQPMLTLADEEELPVGVIFGLPALRSRRSRGRRNSPRPPLAVLHARRRASVYVAGTAPTRSLEAGPPPCWPPVRWRQARNRRLAACRSGSPLKGDHHG